MRRKQSAREQVRKEINRLFRASGMTETELAKKAGVSQKTVNNLLHDRHPPSLVTVEACAAALGVEIWQLFLSDETLDQTASPQESLKLIHAYKTASTAGRDIILRVAEREAEYITGGSADGNAKVR
jgi:transcriptional regulator with XRE-family HTH domain